MRPRILFYCSILLLLSYSSTIIACPPSCDDCYYWDGEDCVMVGNCTGDGDCSDCYSCSSCNCNYDCSGSDICCDGDCEAECCDGDDCYGCEDCDSGYCEDDDSMCSGCCYCDDGYCEGYDGWCGYCEYCEYCDCECAYVNSISGISGPYYVGDYTYVTAGTDEYVTSRCPLTWGGSASFSEVVGKTAKATFNSTGSGLTINAKTNCQGSGYNSPSFTVVQITQFQAKSSNFPKCVGDSISSSDFNITTSPTGYEGSVSVDGLDTSTAGNKTAEATLWNKPDPALQASYTVVEVASLLPNMGTEFDDLDNDPNTKSFVVCIDNSGVVTVTATPNPSISEANLPSCWSLTGGTGTGKLTRTVDRTAAGETELMCSSGSSIKTTTIYVVKGEISLASSSACDGEEVNVDLNVTPSSIKDKITNVLFTPAVPSGVTNYGSPSGQIITFSQRSSDKTEWKIDNARWYSTQSDHCNDTSDYEITAAFEIAGSHTCTTYPYSNPTIFTASAAFGSCLDGAAGLTNTFSGVPSFSTVFNSQTQLWETTVTQGTFVRDVQATSWWTAPANSQYYDMIKNEEQYHETQQMENPTHSRWGTAYLVANIMNSVQASQPYTHTNQTQSYNLAVQAFNAAYSAEHNRSETYLSQQSVRCADESEAKNAVGASHKVAMPCTYPNCP